jgi:protein involved in polysaccharide export with SLBB domain
MRRPFDRLRAEAEQNQKSKMAGFWLCKAHQRNMNLNRFLFPLLLGLAVVRVNAAESLVDLVKAVNSASNSSETYRLSPNDVIKMKVFQEDDLTTEARIGKDGTVTIPLVGVVTLGGKSVEEATGQLRDLFGKDYLVNPQVTLTVLEYAKRRFTVLGQVQKPGTYDIPSEESVTLLQAIAMAGGFTRLAVQGRVSVTRTLGGKRTFSVDLKSAANDPGTKPFEILPDDTIMVGERVF